jgi:hypothetical protein
MSSELRLTKVGISSEGLLVDSEGVEFSNGSDAPPLFCGKNNCVGLSDVDFKKGLLVHRLELEEYYRTGLNCALIKREDLHLLLCLSI